MGETTTVAEKTFSYEGLFDAQELFRLIDTYLSSVHFDYAESINREVVKPDGRYIEIDLGPDRVITDYVKYKLDIKVTMQKLKDVEVKRDGAKVKLNEGKVRIAMAAHYVTDYAGTWETKNPVYYFIRTVVQKFFLKPVTAQYEKELKEITEGLIHELKAFFNLGKF